MFLIQLLCVLVLTRCGGVISEEEEEEDEEQYNDDNVDKYELDDTADKDTQQEQLDV